MNDFKTNPPVYDFKINDLVYIPTAFEFTGDAGSHTSFLYCISSIAEKNIEAKPIAVLEKQIFDNGFHEMIYIVRLLNESPPVKISFPLIRVVNLGSALSLEDACNKSQQTATKLLPIIREYGNDDDVISKIKHVWDNSCDWAFAPY